MNTLIASVSAVSSFDKINTYIDIITFVLAVIGATGSICGWIYFWVTSRKNIELKIFDYTSYHGTIAQLFVHFQNQSHASICIISVGLIFNGYEVCCELIPKKIRGENDSLIKTPMFPINLIGNQGALYFLEFVGFEQIQLTPGSKIVLLINTNHGQIRKSVTLSDTSRYLHIT